MSYIDAFVRSDIRSFVSYTGTSHSNVGRTGKICLDSNEWFEGEWNRYPDPCQYELRNVLADLYRVDYRQIMVTNGSDEAIDLLLRLFCKSGSEKIAIPVPSYAMYKTIADFNGIAFVNYTVNLEEGYCAKAILDSITPEVKVLIICSPNNPTSHLLSARQLSEILAAFQGIIIIDEAYSEFSRAGSLLDTFGLHDRVVYLRTLSKAYGLAGLRIGAVVAQEDLVNWLLSVKLPYNVNLVACQEVMKIVNNPEMIRNRVQYIRRWVSEISGSIRELTFVQKVFASETNFLFIQVKDAVSLHNYLYNNDILVRLRSDIPQGLRISIGSPEENERLIKCFQKFENQY